MTTWVQTRLNIAERLHSGECGGSYSEAMLIVLSIISGIAARVWPGKGIDRARFTQLLIERAPSDRDVSTISLPLLYQSLDAPSTLDLAQRVEGLNQLAIPSARVVLGPEVDVVEDQILIPLPSSELRSFSYANLLYTELRCGFVHEYMAGDKATERAQTTREFAGVTYANRASDGTGSVKRQIHFAFEWALGVASSVAAAGPIDAIDRPDRWWIDG